MPRIPTHTLDDAPEQTRPTLETLSKRMGKLLNIHGGMAHSPVVLATYAAMQETIARLGTFDGKTREAIALAVGAVEPLRLLPVEPTRWAAGPPGWTPRP